MIDLSWLNELSLIPSAASDVRLRAKADHQRIRNRVRGIDRSGHGDVTACQRGLRHAGHRVHRKNFFAL